MEKEKSKNAMIMWALLVCLVSQSAVMPVMCRTLEGVDDQKTYYSPDPHRRSSPGTPKRSHSHKSPSCGTPPSHSGGGYYHSPPSYSGHSPPVVNPPSIVPPTPSTPTITPTIPYPGTPSITPTIPYPGTPSTPTITPTIPDPGTPSTPTIPDPGTPSTPMIPDPNVPPFIIGTCNYWKTHPQLIWGLFGYWGTVGGIFGVPTLGSNLSLQQALANTRSDGISSLYREGTASFLNSMVNKKFPFTTQQVRDRFLAALVSDKAAAAQSQLFKKANEGRLKL